MIPHSAEVIGHRSPLPRIGMNEPRACTCHPSEAPVPCQRRYAFSECKAAAEGTDMRDEMWRFQREVEAARIWQLIKEACA